MKCLASFQEMDILGEGLATAYMVKAKRSNGMCFDIEGFIMDYLRMTILYESFAETDQSKIGFLANGVDPLLVYRKGKPTAIVFPKDTVVIEKALLRREESSRKRFTLAHEAAHKILEMHIPSQTVACFRSDFDSEADYAKADLHRIFSMNETLCNRLAAAILMPGFLVGKALAKYHNGQLLKVYDGGVFAEKDKLNVQRMADCLGVSYSALINRLRELQLLESRPIAEYIEQNLRLGGSI